MVGRREPVRESVARPSRSHPGLGKDPPPAVAAAPVATPWPPREWKRHGLVLAVLWAITLLAYSNSFRGGLLFDASKAVLDDARIQVASAENSRLIWTNDYWYGASTGLYRPATTFSYLFNYAVLGNGPRPAGYHW